ncbi:Spo0E like sporulation regulatory protein [Clostridium aceticum]|uniref:Spo0E like sporulation regulatory protein n=1 Tax=Clostridium aceticum TaxID=84022 RepID=A0A0G3WFS8_9CLOT|nr:aspartyl-phosphate phosphatase Spo0E family protein [Clostridium aceticum]AKL96294.1 Spo0E like sporulation regulatory protein [Clostridium aceticum]
MLDDNKKLTGEIEKVRYQLIKLIEAKKGNLLHPEVVKLSKFLDKLLVKYTQSKI